MTAVSTWIVTSETAGGSVPATSAVDLATALAVAARAAAAATTQAGVATTAATAVTGAVAAVSTQAGVATEAATTATRKADIATGAATTATTEADVATAAAATATTKADVAVAAAATATTKTDVAVAAAATATAKADGAVAAAAAASAAAGSMIASDATPTMNHGIGAAGSSATYARGDHVHPTDTSIGGVPIGTVVFGPWTSAPAGTIKGNGALVSRSAYAGLFAVYGTRFGVGDGSTTFGLPDLRAAFPRGLDDGRGIDTGRVLGSEQLDAFQGHWHLLGKSGNPTYYSGEGQLSTTSNYGAPLADPDGTATRATTPVVDESGNGTPRIATETRPRNIALLACIKY